MEKHPIENIMSATLDGLTRMIDVDTVIGMPVEAAGTTIIPFSRVTFGFVSGGGEYEFPYKGEKTPFAGGTGAGVSLQPVGFLTVRDEEVKLIPVQPANPYERLVELLPSLIGRVKDVFAREEPPEGEE